MSMLLLLLIVVPLAGACVCALMTPQSVKKWALIVSLMTAGAALAIVMSFDFQQDAKKLEALGGTASQLRESVQLELPEGGDTAGAGFGLSDLHFQLHLGVDSISLWLVLLTVLLAPSALLASFESIKDRQKEYYAWMLVLLAAMNGVFIARDLLLFYIFFELTLIPMFFIIGIWGGPERRYAAAKFFLFTFGGSVFTLAAVIYLGLRARTFDLTEVMIFAQLHLSSTERWWILLGLLAGFAVKVPLFPVHTWLPLAHTEAPTAGSVILAGVLLKLGTYGLLRLALPLGLVGVTAAWSNSITHFLGGLCIIGMEGSVLYMINHGLSTGAMFLVIGMIYDRFHTRDINALSGLAKRMPKLAFFFVFFVLGSIGLPGLNGFVSEFLTVLGAFTSDRLGVGFGVLAAIGVILGALYMLHMTAKVIFGPLKIPGEHGEEHGGHGEHETGDKSLDIGAREIGLLVPIALAAILLGLAPNAVLKSIAGPIGLIRKPVSAASADIRMPVSNLKSEILNLQEQP